MGNGQAVMPDSTPTLVKAVSLFRLSKKECESFLAIYNKIDKAQIGKISLEAIFGYMGHLKNAFSEGLLDLIEVNHNGQIDFGQFLLLICTYCMFEEEDILKYCFHLFDEEQMGVVQEGDIKSLMNLLHNINPGEKVGGNVRSAWGKMRFNIDNQADYQELLNHHRKFPLVFQPAFKLHRDMQTCFFGAWFWDEKKEKLQLYRKNLVEASPAGQMEKKLQQKKERIRERGIKKNMGVVRYLACPCLRPFFVEPEVVPAPEPGPDKTAIQKLREEEYRNYKNPDTVAHQEYKNLVRENPEHIPTKLKAGAKNRYLRAEDRRERRAKLKENPLFKG